MNERECREIRKRTHPAHRCVERKETTAEQVFRAGFLPSWIASRRVLTTGSDVDSWKRRR